MFVRSRTWTLSHTYNTLTFIQDFMYFPSYLHANARRAAIVVCYQFFISLIYEIRLAVNYLTLHVLRLVEGESSTSTCCLCVPRQGCR